MKKSNGRFRAPLHPEALEFSTSLDVDSRLFREDIAGSLAHVAMLGRKKIIPARDAATIQRGLRQILGEVESGKLDLRSFGRRRGKRLTAEDVHMAIEARLTELIGRTGGMLHTARSRNDQVALDERLYLVGALNALQGKTRSLQRSLLALAERHRSVIMPGYTHLQRAQPILFAHHLLAYVAMFDRDRERLSDCQRRAAVSPLGAGALAGTSFPIDRMSVARNLQLSGIVDNSIDAVSDRDALVECVSACAMTMMHLSRLSEDLILWSTSEWGFVTIGDGFTTGSSIMPQKKNPDIAELVRGKTGRVYGDLKALLSILKGLPLAYNRDLQEDKEPLFDAVDTTRRSLSIMSRMLGNVHVNRSRFESELSGDTLLATDLADYLVRKGIPFREAHTVVGSIVEECVRRKTSLADLPLKEYRERSEAFEQDLYALLDPAGSIQSKRSAGSTSDAEVSRSIKRWKRALTAPRLK